ncbi:hypothetical protein Skr01_74520 [Sphaerisporangium krabiense]|uniref:Uncharacterized protein n=1 Tax=Sphaerisporangium krabiense TaxID=763782 RepID=A0A7W8Z4C2_9ACTN|nr:hypothetical protein [Sphaerisporangium krabiense]MBB5626833.1 hypothetical protein [Sphaerisporangium krabiense]GII67367.1 hypothetical protein Skr01_74520 [Sphaerisporangium krabiense]
MTYDRTAYISGLRDLADFLDTNPGFPTPCQAVTAYYMPERATDDQMREEVDKIAAYLGSEVDPNGIPGGHYRTSIRFGPVEYRAAAVLAKVRARFTAETSYAGCVIPDSPDE